MKFLNLLISPIRDLLTRISPVVSNRQEYEFAFLVHARNIPDVYRKFPFLKILPNSVVELIARKMWPVVVSEVTGLRSLKTSKEIKGLIIGFLMTAPQMLADRKTALKRITDSAKLAKKMGVSIIGLGALTSSLSRGGLDIVDKVDINITTGHAYTAHTVAANVNKMVDMFKLKKDKITVAVVGASGSIGSTTAQLLARNKYKHLILIEIKRKIKKIESLVSELKLLNPNLIIETTSDMRRLRNADIIVTATNAADAVVRNEHLKKGAIIVDDAQPSDIAPEVLDNDEVLTIEAGVVHTPHVDNHFNFGLKDKYDNFCCMCEIMILAANEWREHYVVNRADLALIDKIVDLGEGLNFRLAELQNFKEVISDKKISKLKNILS